MRRPIKPSPSFGSLKAQTPLVFPGQSVGVMGGSFNPPHQGHALVARVALRRLRLDQVWWVVTPGNPLKEAGGLPPIDVRIAKTRGLANDPHMRVTGFEAALGSSFTVDTLAFLRRRHPGVRFVWVMGADGLANFHRWRQWRRIAALMPIAVIDRPGYRLRAMASPAARSMIRFYVGEQQASRLQRAASPCWTFLTTRLSPISSTKIRAESIGNGRS